MQWQRRLPRTPLCSQTLKVGVDRTRLKGIALEGWSIVIKYLFGLGFQGQQKRLKAQKLP